MSQLISVETKGILFDMDGVLVSSIGSVVRSWKQWAKMYDVPDAENYEVPHGMRAIEIVKGLRPDIDQARRARRLLEEPWRSPSYDRCWGCCLIAAFCSSASSP